VYTALPQWHFLCTNTPIPLKKLLLRHEFEPDIGHQLEFHLSSQANSAKSKKMTKIKARCSKIHLFL